MDNNTERDNLKCSINSNDIKVAYMPAKAINFTGAFVLAFGNIVGSGIFVAVMQTFDVFSTGTPIGMVLIFWLIAGFISFTGALCYAELGTRWPESGGERVYYKRCLGNGFAAVFVIFFVFIIKALTVAALCIATGRYIFRVFETDESKNNPIVVQIIAIINLILCLIINCASKKFSIKAGLVLTVLKTLAMLIIIGCGIYYMATNQASDWDKPFTLENFSIEKLGDCFIALFWAFEGWNSVGLVAGDMINPTRDLPLATMLGVAIVTILYIMCIASYSSILSYATCKTSQTIGASLANKVFPSISFIIPLLISCSTAGAANGILYSIASTSASAGFSGELPKIFSLLHKKQRTPIFSLFVIFFCSFIFTFLNFEDILKYCAFLTWLFYFLSFICLWKIKIQTRGKELTGIFQVPFVCIIPIQFVCIFVIVMSFKQEYIGCAVFLAVFLIVLALHYIPARFKSFEPMERLHVFAIKYLEIRCGLVPATAKDVS